MHACRVYSASVASFYKECEAFTMLITDILVTPHKRTSYVQLAIRLRIPKLFGPADWHILPSF